MSEHAHTNYDAIIVGAGLAGLSLACLLGARGMRIACVDASDFKGSAKTDLRTTAISYGSRKILQRAGVWQKITRACPIDKIDILDGGAPTLLEFMAAEVEGKTFGWIVDNTDLKEALHARLSKLDNAEYIAPFAAAAFDVCEDSASVSARDGRTLRAPLIIGADGRGSRVRGWMEEQGHCTVRTTDYRQRAVICTVYHQNPHQNTAIEHFFPAGPFAVLPYCDDEKGRHRSSVVFTEHGPKDKSLMHLSDSEFELAMAARFPASYGDITLASARQSYPLGLVHANAYIAPRMALVADAAHAIHPIAGQGLNLGFRDMDVLGELLGEAFARGEDVGAKALLEDYQRRRRPDNMAMIAMTDGLNRLFGNDSFTLKLARRAGLKAVARLKPAKRFFMRTAMGERRMNRKHDMP